jgi:cytochrome c biogenesis protein CcdA
MLKPRGEKPTSNPAQKFVRIFTLLMTLLYVALGVFLIFIDETQLNLNISDEVRIVLGGILILYGAVRFIRVYKLNKRSKNKTYED